MLVLKVAPVFLLVLAVGAEKKIELQDIEEDNLKSEKEKEVEKDEGRQAPNFGQGQGLFSLDFLRDNFPKYFTSTSPAQQPRYVQQYAVTEQPEHPPTAEGSVSSPKSEYGPPSHQGQQGPQQAMVGYLSNVPMQIYLVPHYYNEHAEQASSSQGPSVAAVKYAPSAGGRIAAYPTAAEAVPQQTNYIEVPAYVTPTGAAYIQPFTSPAVQYVTYAHPTMAPAHPTVGPVMYQMPIQYQTAIVAPPTAPKGYQYYTEMNSVDDTENEVESPKHYVTQTEPTYHKPTAVENPRYYNSRTPVREEYRHSPISEIPPPNPILLKSPPPHLSHLPKALPMFRPLSKPVYAAAGNLLTSAYTSRPSESYSQSPYKRRPSSLLDSYIPSGLQVEYLKRGYSKDPLQIYEALAMSGRHFSNPSGGPRHYERGFLPNQMYHTGSGGIIYGHYKRMPKGEKVAQSPQK
ncbi:hypothetical protein O0L34_g13940 [Tuta absoluta]|nr:hypothetical protein O0L34_g13940 [Tuta absoluta]